jgi:uncharacterized membrane protein YraQ (UPF0718 family)
LSKPSYLSGTRGNGELGAMARTLRAFMHMLPIVLGMLLLTSLILAWLPSTQVQTLFGRYATLDVLLGAVLGSVAMGHPLAGYILGGELLAGGVSLIAVTALIVSWVTVGVVQLPAEALLLGRRFAFIRNGLCFLSAIAIAYLTVGVLRLLG